MDDIDLVWRRTEVEQCLKNRDATRLRQLAAEYAGQRG
jgi:hypothetical protein